jgi:lipoprotein-anchoring transpeptidase ErfK/SrfK
VPKPSLTPRTRRLAALVALLVSVGLVASACSSSKKNNAAAPSNTASSSTPAPSTPAPSTSASKSPTPTKPAVPTKTVRVTSDLGDGAKVGVGEPIVLNFDPAPTDSSAFTKAVTVTVNGQPANGYWYWEKPYADEPIEAHYREQGYWPANATIQVKLPIGGLSAGAGLVYAGALNSVTFQTGDAHISTVDASTLQMTVTSNGQVVKTVPVSLGAAQTPTFNGIKVVMQKGEDVPGTNTLRANGTVMMSGPGYSNDPVPWSVRVTASGEYVHAAGWNTQIGIRSTSNGCTNLKPADGQWFYNFSMLGDVVKYVNTDGTQMSPTDGLGDWNVNWGLWMQGGLLLNH